MNNSSCPVCGTPRVRDGKTRAGKQRWLCRSCSTSTTRPIDTTAKNLALFLNWLFGKASQNELHISGRTFRRKTAQLWSIWPLVPITGEVHRVIFVDAIHLSSHLVILIAASEEYVLGWYLARSENARAWGALMRTIPAPLVVVCDGGTGFEKARRQHWPQTRVQRCLFHVYCHTRRYTTSRPRLQAGVELYGLARTLLHVTTPAQAAQWTASFIAWDHKWSTFLAQKSIDPLTGRHTWTHKPLVQARNSLTRLVKTGTLFTFLAPDLTSDGPLPSTNNRIESLNARIRQLWRLHRGMNNLHRAKAAFWWCYMHTENPLPAAEILRTMPTDNDITHLYQTTIYNQQEREGPAQWGEAIVWADLHHQTPWNTNWD